MYSRHFKRYSRGYSLAEILISIAIVAIGLLAVTGTIPVGYSYLRVIGERYFVVQQAQGQMEAIKSMKYTKLLKDYASPPYKKLECKPLHDIKDPAKKYPKYRSMADITRDPNEEGVLHIKVEIYWIESNSYGKTNASIDSSYILDGYKTKGIK